MSVFVPVPYCLDDCGFIVEPEVRQVDSSSSILISQDCFGNSRFFVFPSTLSLTKETRIYNGVKTISLTSGAGKTGQPLVKE